MGADSQLSRSLLSRPHTHLDRWATKKKAVSFGYQLRVHF
jgi:hypothetical protein